jgi:hypothetical protein
MEKRLLRLGGATVLVASAVLAIITVVGIVYGGNATNPVNIAAHAIAMPAALLLVVGLPALVAAMASRAALLSAIGFALFAFSVLVYQFATAMFDAFILPWLVAQHFEGVSAKGAFVGQMPTGFVAVILTAGFALIIGSILLGVAILRSGAFSRVAAILLIAGGAISLPVPPIGWLVSLGGLAIAGWQLAGFSYKRAVAANPTAAATSA